MAKTKVATRKKKKTIREVAEGKAYIQSTFNNTIITITDLEGNVLAWASAGRAGFKGTKKSTPYASTATMKLILEKVAPFALKKVDVLISGVGSGREAAVRALGGSGIEVRSIKDITPIPHNGPQAKRPRRV